MIGKADSPEGLTAPFPGSDVAHPFVRLNIPTREREKQREAEEPTKRGHVERKMEGKERRREDRDL